MKTKEWAFVCVAALLAACSEHTPATQKLDPVTSSVGIMALQWPRAVPAKSDFTAKLAIRNLAGATIPSLGADKAGTLRVNATYHWKGTDQRIVVWDGVLTPLAADLVPGAVQKIDVRVRAPESPGTYLLEFDLVQTGAFWFGGAGSQTAAVMVEVR